MIYSAHLEVFCGLLARIAQLSDIFADARAMADAGFQHQAILGEPCTPYWAACMATTAALHTVEWCSASGAPPRVCNKKPARLPLPCFCDPVALLPLLPLLPGDMNTMAHGIARLSPSYCCDHMRFRWVPAAAKQCSGSVACLPWP